MDVYAELTWSGDWESRVMGRIQKLGFDRIADFLSSVPGASYLDVAESLGIDVAAIQLIRLQIQEAKRLNAVRETAQDCLVRCLTRSLVSGWTISPGDATDFKTASAAGDWVSYLTFDGEMPELRQKLFAVWEALKGMRPSLGWKPSGPQDPLVVAAFQQAWPVDSQ